jgi:hypothetical protein
MTVANNRSSESGLFFKKKVLLLGGQEDIKDTFQENISINTLSMKNKNTIGVNISRVDILSNHNHFEYFLWNINCTLNKAFLRTIFYQGAEAAIVFISEDKVEQIQQYYKEIVARLPVITIIFCILYQHNTIGEIKEAYFSTPSFKKLLHEKDFIIHQIQSPTKMFDQVGSSFLEKIQTNELYDNFIIDFIPLKSVIENEQDNYVWEDYFEARQNNPHYERRINTEKIKMYLKKLQTGVEWRDSDWVHIPNRSYGGNFSVFLRNGNVYFVPKKCLICNKKDCYRKNWLNNYVCIEAKTEGWSNITGLKQKELLLLSKILLLKNADTNSLPESISNQIKKYCMCPHK